MTKLPDARSILAERFDVSRETLERLDLYEMVLRERSQTLSLVGRATLDTVWERHFLDSAQLFPLIPVSNIVLDMGSGAGFPGLVLAIMGIEQVHLVENNQLKASFLADVATRTDTRVTIHNMKVEALPPLHVDTVTSRALAPLETLLALGQRFFDSGAAGLFPKGRKAASEVEDARKQWDFELERFPSVTSDESSILRLTRIRRKV